MQAEVRGIGAQVSVHKLEDAEIMIEPPTAPMAEVPRFPTCLSREPAWSWRDTRQLCVLAAGRRSRSPCGVVAPYLGQNEVTASIDGSGP